MSYKLLYVTTLDSSRLLARPTCLAQQVFLSGVSGLVHNSELWKNDEEREPFCVGDLIPVLVLEPREGKQAFSR